MEGPRLHHGGSQKATERVPMVAVVRQNIELSDLKNQKLKKQKTLLVANSEGDLLYAMSLQQGSHLSSSLKKASPSGYFLGIFFCCCCLEPSTRSRQSVREFPPRVPFTLEACLQHPCPVCNPCLTTILGVPLHPQ